MNKLLRWGLGVAVAAVSFPTLTQATGDGSPLIDALIKKGILSDQEAEEIRSEMQQNYMSTPGGMIEWGSSAVKAVKIYGDIRARYQWENAQDAGAGANRDRSRYRYRARVGADYTFAENWKAGIRLETSNASDSTNVDFGRYFDKVGDGVGIGLAYLQYENTDLFGSGLVDYIDVRLGKHKHPFLLSKAWWDGDLNPEGISEQVGWEDVGVKGLDFTLRGGQYIISNTDERNSLNIGNNADAWLFIAQTELEYSWAKKTGIKVAPMVLWETRGDQGREEVTGFATATAGTSLTNENQDMITGNLLVLAIPVEAKWKMWNLPWKAFATYGHNFDGDDMKESALNFGGDASAAGEADERNFFNVGLQAGKAKKKGSWQVGAEYRYVQAFAYSPNLSDSDFGKNLQNQQGVVLSAKYAFTDNIYGGISWLHSNDIDESIDIDNGLTGESDGHVVDVLQVDLNWKF